MPPSRTGTKSSPREAPARTIASPLRQPSVVAVATRPRVGVYAITIFLSAFLLFQVQLVMGKFILPRFGGGPSVWSTSLLMFQLLLLAGYGYAAFICANFEPAKRARIHLTLLAISGVGLGLLAWLWHSPIFPAFASRFRPSANPVWQILLLLLCAVGLHTVVLSATSPLLQKWFSASNGEAVPYRLYALSNFGSMLGLLSYPFVIERFLTLSAQAWLWSAGYAIFVFTAALCSWLQLNRPTVEPPLVIPKALPKSRRKKSQATRPKILWLLLAACGSTMLLATTNLICQEITVVPLLWVLPLSLYLLSFIICFDHAAGTGVKFSTRCTS
jgi:hypothetical protein